MASTSSREIGFAAAAPAVAPDEVAGPDGADAGDPGVAPADGATFAPCLEPKMADTMLPNTLMLPSCPYCLGCTRHAGARFSTAAHSRVLRSPVHSEARRGDDAISAFYFLTVAVRCSGRAATSQPTR